MARVPNARLQWSCEPSEQRERYNGCCGRDRDKTATPSESGCYTTSADRFSEPVTSYVAGSTLSSLLTL